MKFNNHYFKNILELNDELAYKSLFIILYYSTPVELLDNHLRLLQLLHYGTDFISWFPLKTKLTYMTNVTGKNYNIINNYIEHLEYNNVPMPGKTFGNFISYIDDQFVFDNIIFWSHCDEIIYIINN